MTWCQGNVTEHRHWCGKDHGFLMASHHWKQFQRGHWLSQFTSLRGIPPSLDTSSTEILDCWGFRHCKGKSSPRILEHPCFVREEAQTPSSKSRHLGGLPATAPQHNHRVSCIQWKKYLRSLSPTMCHLDLSTYLPHRQLFY